MKRKDLSLLIVTLFIVSGCAVFNRDNTPVLNTFEKYAVPKNKATRVISYPVLIPAGLIAVSIDAIVIHPVTVIDEAYKDTTDRLWDDLDWENQYVTGCASLIPRTTLSPFVFTGRFLGRSMFDFKTNRNTIENKIHQQKLQQQIDSLHEKASIDLEKAKVLFNQKHYSSALIKVDLALEKYQKIPTGLETKTLILIADGKNMDLYNMFKNNPQFLWNEEISDSILQSLTHKNKAQQMSLLLLLEYTMKQPKDKSDFNRFNKIYNTFLKEGIAPLLNSEDRAIIYQAMRVISAINSDESKAILNRLSKDADPVFSTTALKLLKNYD